jgi:hypothetical protein
MMSECLAHTPEYGDVKFLVDSLLLQNKSVMSNTPGIEKKKRLHSLCFRWLPPHFLWRWRTHWPPFGTLPLRLRVVFETSWFILGKDTVDELFCALCNKSVQTEACPSFLSWVSVCGTSLALSFRLPKSSHRSWSQVNLLIFRASANMCTVTVWSSRTMSLMWTM